MRWLPAVLLLAVVPVPAHAGTGTLTLTGSASGYADVRLRLPVTLRPDAFTVRTSGSYAGFAIEHAGTLLAVGIRAPSFGADPVPIDGQRDVVLQAGTYRFVLLTDGRASVSLALDGAARTVTVTKPVTVTGHVLDLTPVVTAVRRVPLPSGRRTFATLATSVYSDIGVFARTAACFGSDPAAQCAPADYTTVLVNERSIARASATAWPGHFTEPGVEGVFEVDAATVGTRATGFYLAFDAP